MRRRNTRVRFDYKPLETTRRTSNRARWLAVGLTLPLLGAALAYYLPAPEPLAVEEPPPMAAVTEATPEPEVAVVKPFGATVDFVVRRNDTLERIFRRLKLSLDDLATILRLPDARTRFQRLRPGDKLTVVHEDGAVHALKRRISETEILAVTRGETGFAAEVITTPIELRPTYASGKIDTSLFVAARAAGVSPETTLRLANDIFGWDIDFALDIRPGDRFNLLYEQKYREGNYIGDGRIMVAEFFNDGRTYRAIHYASADGKIADYFTPEGRSMRQQFLRAPLDFTRVSSNFNPNRRHPLLKIVRAHKGVDYAAPTGTVIKAAGDGRVRFVGVQGGYGRVVILEHGGGVSTLYGHMSRFAKGLRKGERVRQGATIGYVGSSGAATGPHLHYEYRVNGVHHNPRTVRLPDAAPLPARYKAEFQAHAASMMAELERAQGASKVAASSFPDDPATNQ